MLLGGKGFAAAVPDDFRAYVPSLVRQALASIEAIDLTEMSSNNSASSGADIGRMELILKHKPHPCHGVRNRHYYHVAANAPHD